MSVPGPSGWGVVYGDPARASRCPCGCPRGPRPIGTLGPQARPAPFDARTCPIRGTHGRQTVAFSRYTAAPEASGAVTIGLTQRAHEPGARGRHGGGLPLIRTQRLGCPETSACASITASIKETHPCVANAVPSSFSSVACQPSGAPGTSRTWSGLRSDRPLPEGFGPDSVFVSAPSCASQTWTQVGSNATAWWRFALHCSHSR